MGAHDPDDCLHCGDRCEGCGERLCATYGAEPATTCLVHWLCVECAPHEPRCRECVQARKDAA